MTAPTMSPYLDEVALEELVPPCEIPFGTGDWLSHLGQPCPHTADWVAIKRCCGATRLMCDYHKRFFEEWWAEGLTSKCISCGSSGVKQWAFLERL